MDQRASWRVNVIGAVTNGIKCGKHVLWWAGRLWELALLAGSNAGWIGAVLGAFALAARLVVPAIYAWSTKEALQMLHGMWT
eukprot:14178377-Alexandrium_andersonii.AAC.1